MPAKRSGPNAIRNGIALSGKVDWVLDRGLIGFGGDRNILSFPHGLPDEMVRQIRLERKLLMPGHPAIRLQSGDLAWRRAHQFRQ
ncbi:MAG: hypothetical protein CVV18_06985 [Gammaproteobacteria bacterium HGW-Gammaproteobacteria-8]|nr:MAG: hypothetical protein CVV18_06985 [Gammaproteobacteria bacterium HGW-Gammaproteobacteria-8]